MVLSRNMTSRLAIEFPNPYERWSNSLPPGQEKASNVRGMPGGMLKLPFDWYITRELNWQRLVFTSDRVVVGAVIRSVERNDLVKIKRMESEAEHWFCLWLRRLRSSENWIVGTASRSGRINNDNVRLRALRLAGSSASTSDSRRSRNGRNRQKLNGNVLILPTPIPSSFNMTPLTTLIFDPY